MSVGFIIFCKTNNSTSIMLCCRRKRLQQVHLSMDTRRWPDSLTSQPIDTTEGPRPSPYPWLYLQSSAALLKSCSCPPGRTAGSIFPCSCSRWVGHPLLPARPLYPHRHLYRSPLPGWSRIRGYFPPAITATRILMEIRLNYRLHLQQLVLADRCLCLFSWISDKWSHPARAHTHWYSSLINLSNIKKICNYEMTCEQDMRNQQRVSLMMTYLEPLLRVERIAFGWHDLLRFDIKFEAHTLAGSQHWTGLRTVRKSGYNFVI